MKREFEEELHAKIEIDSLFAVGEVFFPWGQKPYHQICLYYKVHLLNNYDIPLDGSFHEYDDLDNKRIDLDFCWVPCTFCFKTDLAIQIPICREVAESVKSVFVEFYRFMKICPKLKILKVCSELYTRNGIEFFF